MSKGSAAGLMSGDSVEYSFALKVQPTGSLLINEAAGQGLNLGVFASMLNRIADQLKLIKSIFGEDDLAVEWCWDGRELYIVQARPLGMEKIPEPSPISRVAHMENVQFVSLPRQGEWGLKAAAEEYFAHMGVGAKNGVILAPELSDTEVLHVFENRSESEHGTVLRLSISNSVGAPKRFVPAGGDPGDEYLRMIYDLREKLDDIPHAGIVSDYSFVDASFESYLSETALIVEHVPGQWESSNRLKPDVFLWTHDGFEMYRFKRPREAEIEIPGVGMGGVTGSVMRSIPPLEDRISEAWAMRMFKQFSAMKVAFAQDLPINVHFVADDSDNWYFLNIRPTKHIDPNMQATFKETRYWPVMNANDVESWDGQSAILLNSLIDRTQLGSVATVAKALVARGVTEVVSSFGLLSHPAMILRNEFGIQVRPMYTEHERRNIGLRSELWA